MVKAKINVDNLDRTSKTPKPKWDTMIKSLLAYKATLDTVIQAHPTFGRPHHVTNRLALAVNPSHPVMDKVLLVLECTLDTID
jgi:hypothetical protein